MDGTGVSTTANAGEDQTICVWDIIWLNGFGGDLYLWSIGESEKRITIRPLRVTTFILELTKEGVTSLDSLTIIVENCDQQETSLKLNDNSTLIYHNPTNEIINISVKDLKYDLLYQFISLSGKHFKQKKISSIGPIYCY